MDSIAVLLSSYNGEKYIQEQIDSIINQRNVSVTLFVRDDKSSDKTCEILSKYEKLSNVSVIYGEHLGVIESFEWLINNVPMDYDYYAFSDQDDIWHEDKLNRAIEFIKERNKINVPILYSCNQNCVNSEGKFRMIRMPQEKVRDNVIASLIQTEYPACTMVLNKCLLKHMRYTYRVAKKELRSMHDGWALAIAQSIGEFIYDPVPMMDFRRHDSNYTQGIRFDKRSFKDSINELKHNFKSLMRYKYYKGRTAYRARLLIHCYKNKLSSEDLKNLEIFGTYKKNIFNWLKLITINPLRKHYMKPYFNTWLKFFIGMY